MSFSKTWNNVINDDSIELMEHPVYNTLIPKEEFYLEFGKILDQLDGGTMTDFVDFFFQRDILNKSNLKFTSDNEKMDFYDWAVEEGCLPEIKEIHQGESLEDKILRMESEERKKEEIRLREDSQRIQKEKNDQKKNNMTEYDIILKKLENKWKNIEKIKKKNNPTKIQKAIDGFNTDYENFKKEYHKIDKYETTN